VEISQICGGNHDYPCKTPARFINPPSSDFTSTKGTSSAGISVCHRTIQQLDKMLFQITQIIDSPKANWHINLRRNKFPLP
jgi:hypothetical protein